MYENVVVNSLKKQFNEEWELRKNALQFVKNKEIKERHLDRNVFLKKRKSPLLPSSAKERPGLGVIISGLTVIGVFFAGGASPCWWELLPDGVVAAEACRAPGNSFKTQQHWSRHSQETPLQHHRAAWLGSLAFCFLPTVELLKLESVISVPATTFPANFTQQWKPSLCLWLVVNSIFAGSGLPPRKPLSLLILIC